MKRKLQRGFGCMIILSIFFLKPGNAVWLLFISILIPLFLERRAFRPFRHIRFWVIYFLILFIFPFFTAAPDRYLWFIGFNQERMTATILMSVRSIIIFLGIQLLVLDLTAAEIRFCSRRLGIRGIDTVLPAAQDMLPRLRDIIHRRSAEFRNTLKQSGLFSTGYNFLTDLILDLTHLVDTQSALEMTVIADADGLLLNILKTGMEKRLVILAGDEHSGKTSIVSELGRKLTAAGLTPGGIISPGTMRGDRKQFIYLRDIRTGDQQLLAESKPFSTDLTMGKYYFHPAAFEWGLSVFDSAMGADVLILDEAGPLELQDDGFSTIPSKWAAAGKGILLVTVRSSLTTTLVNRLMEQAGDQWPVEIFSIETHFGD